MFGSATQTWYHHPSPVVLASRDPSASDSKPQSLSALCKSVVPPFYPHPLIRGGHLQTCAILLGAKEVPIHYKRIVLTADNADSDDHGIFSVDVVVPPPSSPETKETPSKKVLLETDPEYFPPRTSMFSEEEFASWESDTETTPLIVTLHGLSGGSHETYVRLALEPMVRPKSEGGLGYDALVVNARGCAWTKLASQYPFRPFK